MRIMYVHVIFFVEDASIFDDALYKINYYWVGKMLGFVSL